MQTFEVFIEGGSRHGEQVYFNNDYEHPPVAVYDDLHLNVDEGLRMRETYNNNTDETVGFGFLSTDEMMILFGKYYNGH